MNGVQPGWLFSAHALAAMRARGFSRDEVLDALACAQVSYDQGHRGHGRRIYQLGRVCVVASTVTRTVITVLLRKTQPWTDADCFAPQ